MRPSDIEYSNIIMSTVILHKGGHHCAAPATIPALSL